MRICLSHVRVVPLPFKFITSPGSSFPFHHFFIFIISFLYRSLLLFCVSLYHHSFIPSLSSYFYFHHQYVSSFLSLYPYHLSSFSITGKSHILIGTQVPPPGTHEASSPRVSASVVVTLKRKGSEAARTLR